MKSHKGMLTREEFIKQFDTKLDISKSDRRPQLFKVFRGVQVYYIYMFDDIITNLLPKKTFNDSKKQKYKLVMAIKKPDGEFYGGGVV